MGQSLENIPDKTWEEPIDEVFLKHLGGTLRELIGDSLGFHFFKNFWHVFSKKLWNYFLEKSQENLPLVYGSIDYRHYGYHIHAETDKTVAYRTVSLCSQTSTSRFLTFPIFVLRLTFIFKRFAVFVFVAPRTTISVN